MEVMVGGGQYVVQSFGCGDGGNKVVRLVHQMNKRGSS